MITKFIDLCMDLEEPWGFITFMGTVFVGIFFICGTLAFLSTYAPSLLFTFFVLIGVGFIALYITGLVKLFRARKSDND